MATLTALVEELRFRVMGTDAHVLVVDGPPGAADRARARLDELERRWSRFLPDSEVSRLSAAAGTAVEVSDDTVLLVSLAAQAWRDTGATFDPTVLGAIVRAGYDRDFDALDPAAAPVASDLVIGCSDIEVDGHQVRLPPDTGFDPGGIGKGLAADLVVDELRVAGAAGACVNLGGDLRCFGAGPDGEGWTIAIEHPWHATPLGLIGVGDGAVATSTTLKRRWTVGGHARHHIIDPRTGEPAVTDLNHVTVVAGAGWQAEVLAKAVLIRGSAHPFDLTDGTGVEVMFVDDDGVVRASAGFAAYLGDGELVARITPPT